MNEIIEAVNRAVADAQAKASAAVDAAALEALLRTEWPDADIRTAPCTALCSFYAESGGILVGYESCAD